MADVRVRALQSGDVAALVAGMRQADVDELVAAGIENFPQAIGESVARSSILRTATVDGALACIFGVVPAGGMFDPEGVPWMLGTDLVTRNQRALMRMCRPYIRQMLDAYPHLFNYVHTQNAAAVRWLKVVGFTLQPAAPYGPHGAPFHRFDMRA